VTARSILSAAALADLREIGDFIAADNRDRALSFVREIRATCRSAASHPLAYPAREEIAPGVRQALHGRYRILFRPLPGGGVRILRIVHGARDLARLDIETR
jgi:toxin ParE1/3/4